MTVEELWSDFLQPWLARIENKLDAANGRSRKNSWNIKALWWIFGAIYGLGTMILVIYLKARLGG